MTCFTEDTSTTFIKKALHWFARHNNFALPVSTFHGRSQAKQNIDKSEWTGRFMRTCHHRSLHTWVEWAVVLTWILINDTYSGQCFVKVQLYLF